MINLIGTPMYLVIIENYIIRLIENNNYYKKILFTIVNSLLNLFKYAILNITTYIFI